jgi:hypothetical protein
LRTRAPRETELSHQLALAQRFANLADQCSAASLSRNENHPLVAVPFEPALTSRPFCGDSLEIPRMAMSVLRSQNTPRNGDMSPGTLEKTGTMERGVEDFIVKRE